MQGAGASRLSARRPRQSRPRAQARGALGSVHPGRHPRPPPPGEHHPRASHRLRGAFRRVRVRRRVDARARQVLRQQRGRDARAARGDAGPSRPAHRVLVHVLDVRRAGVAADQRRARATPHQPVWRVEAVRRAHAALVRRGPRPALGLPALFQRGRRRSRRRARRGSRARDAPDPARHRRGARQAPAAADLRHGLPHGRRHGSARLRARERPRRRARVRAAVSAERRREPRVQSRHRPGPLRARSDRGGGAHRQARRAAPRRRAPPRRSREPDRRARAEPRAAGVDAAALRSGHHRRHRLALVRPLNRLELARPLNTVAIAARPRVAGKFLYAGAEKLWIKGVTYGTFRPDANGAAYPCPERVRSDFAAMAASGINAVRLYTMPPRALLDEAQRQGLRVLVGVPWEQHVAFLDVPGRAADIEARLRTSVGECAGHPAVLAYAVGNEIPPDIVRWHGRRRIERFLRRLYGAVKAEDPEALATYVSFPTTEYLELPFLDFVCFNVYLESPQPFEAYLARLQNLAGERPLVMAEIGLDSRRNGTKSQAESIAWQVRSAFAAGCAGTFGFAWTDEWHRGGFEIEDWDFGLTARDRRPKPALAALRDAYVQVPFPVDASWPRISVVICSYNGSRTVRDTLDALELVSYPDFEVILVDDGSTDATPEIAAEYGVRCISTENRGLSAARNSGWQAASGEIVAYIDDDAYPDPHWLH